MRWLMDFLMKLKVVNGLSSVIIEQWLMYNLEIVMNEKKPFAPRIEVFSAFKKPFSETTDKVVHDSAEKAAACCACTACTACR